MQLRNPDRRRRGSALLATVAMTMTIAMLSAVLLQQSVSHLRTQSGSVDKKQALYLAEAGLAEGLHSLRAGGSGNIGDATTPAAFGNGAFWVEATETQQGMFLVEATAIVGGARATLETVVEPVFDMPATFGLVGLSDLKIGAGASVAPYVSDPSVLETIVEQLGSRGLINATNSLGVPLADLYDPALGALDVTGAVVDGLETVDDGSGRDLVELPFQLLLGSNGSIGVDGSLATPTLVKGDALPGPEGSVQLGMNAEVTGSTAPRLSEIEPPEIQLPSLTVEPPFRLPDGASLTVGPDERAFSKVTIGAGSTFRINGPAKMLARSIVVEPGARFEIDTTNGPVELYTNGGIKFAARSRLVNLNEDPGGLSLYVTGGTPRDLDQDGVVDPNVTLPQAGTLELQIVAPNALVEIPAGTRFSGSAIADELVVGDGVELRYDNALLVGEEGEAHLEVISWQVAELPRSDDGRVAA